MNIRMTGSLGVCGITTVTILCGTRIRCIRPAMEQDTTTRIFCYLLYHETAGAVGEAGNYTVPPWAVPYGEWLDDCDDYYNDRYEDDYDDRILQIFYWL